MKRAPLALWFCLLAASCTSAPVAEVRVSHTPDPAPPADAGTGLVIEIDGRSVDRLPTGLGSLLASGSPRITGPVNELRGASPSAAETVLLIRDRDLPEPGSLPDFGFVDRLATTRALVPAGCTAILAITPPRPGKPPEPAIEFLIRASGDTPELLLRAPRRLSEEEAVLSGPKLPDIQTLRVPWPLDQPRGEFILALAPGESLDRATLWRLRIRPIADQGPAATEARELAAALRAPAPRESPAAPLARSLRLAGAPAQWRSALAFAAIDSGAPLTAEVAPVADDATLQALVAAAAEGLEKPTSSDTGWCLDRATLLALGKLHADNALDRGLAAVLSAAFGEVGRDVPGLARLAGAAATRADFNTRLEAEHLILLEDSSPAMRVRAFDFLASRNAAPAGYDPLGPVKARRQAVEHHLQSLESRP